ncbi:MAG: helix-turn-helix domain-containing protein, partial [Candidatus Hydrogenedentota bacterium]
LKTAARGLGALIESVVDLMSREALLGQVRSYAERDFASFALTQRDASIDEIASRAKALGFSETPSVVIVAQPDRTSRALLENRNRQTDPTLRDLFEAAQELLRNEPNSLVCSIRPGELLILLSPRRTRNPSLAHLRVQEIMERLRNTLDSKCAVPLMLGVSNYDAPIISLAKAYEEAHANMGKDVLSSMAPDPTIETQTEQVLSRMTELGSEVRRTIRNTDRSALESALQAQLRLVRGCPEDNNNARQCLFTQMVLNLLSALRTISNNDAEIMHIETRYALAMPTLRTANDMIEWFFAHLLPLADRTLLEPSAKSNQIVLKACDLAARQLSHPLAREEVAGALGLSGTYFGKIFRAQTGITFREFMKRLRISKAQSLLLLPGKSVAETAVEVGYSTTAAFSRGFEQVCGASPTAYRTNPHAFPRITLPEKLKV